MKKKMSRMEVLTKQTDQVLNKLIERVNETEVLPWQMPWKCASNGISPFNFNTKHVYQGSNVMLLHFASYGKIPAFSVSSKACPPKKGTKATYILKPIHFKKTDKVTGEEKSMFGGCKLIPVFHYLDLNGVDCEAIEAKYGAKTEGTPLSFNPIAKCEEVIALMPNAPSIDNLGGNRAFYSPSMDSISLPESNTFESENAYYQTMFHELAHSTGHFTRLNRFKKNDTEFKIHDHSYGYEELVAELTACFIGSETGSLTERETSNSASYLKSWIGKLQENPDWLIKASQDANKASEAILGIKKAGGDSE